MGSQKTNTIQALLHRYQPFNSRSLAGAIKTYPLKTLLQDEVLLKNALSAVNPPEEGPPPFLKKTLEMIKKAIEKRVHLSQNLIENLFETSPEVFTLHHTLDKLLQYWNLLEDVKIYYKSDPEALKRLIKATTNLFEALNIKIQLDFFNSSPQLIAFKYSEEQMLNYQFLLRRILSSLNTSSDLYKIYRRILTNLLRGLTLFRKKVKPIKELYLELGVVSEEFLISSFEQYPTKKLENYETLLKATLTYVETIPVKSSNLRIFKDQCQVMLLKVLTPLKIRKAYMVQTIRVLRLCDHIMLIERKDIAKNLAKVLITCRGLLRQTREFFSRYPHQTDYQLDLKVIEKAEKKIEQSLKLRGKVIQVFCRDLNRLSVSRLAEFAPSILKNCLDLLEETESILTEYIGMRMPVSPQVEKTLEIVQQGTGKIKEALALQKYSENHYSYNVPFHEIIKYPPNRSYRSRLAVLVFDSIAVVEQAANDLQVKLSPRKSMEAKIVELAEYIKFLSQERAEEQEKQENEREVLKMAELVELKD